MGVIHHLPATMKHHQIKISFALILIFGGVKQITLGRSALAETQDESPDYNQYGHYADLRNDTPCDIGVGEKCDFFEFNGSCSISDCSKQLSQIPNGMECVKKCEDYYRSIVKQNQNKGEREKKKKKKKKKS